MAEFLIKNQGMIEGLGIVGVVLAACLLALLVLPRFLDGLHDDPLSGTRYGRDFYR